MTANERVYTAMDGGMPDRVPVVPKIWVDLGAALTNTPLVDVVTNPMTALRVIAGAGRLCRVDAVRLFHFPERRLVERDGLVYEVDPGGTIVGEVDMQGGLSTHLSDPARFDVGDVYRMSFHHYWAADAPFVRDVDDAARIAVPDHHYFEQLGWAERLEAIRSELPDDITILGDCSSGTMAFLVCLRGMTQAMIDLIDEPQLVHAVMEKGVRIAVEKAKFNVDHGITMLRLNDSVGNMSVMSPSHWREFVFPHMRDFCTEVHAYDPAARIYCHICGNTLPIAEDLVETGLDCIGPLDPLGGMTPADIRARVGDAVSLMGGVNTLSFVNNTDQEVVDEAHACIDGAGASGGFILGSGCVVPRSARLETVAALRTAAETFGRYEAGPLAQVTD